MRIILFVVIWYLCMICGHEALGQGNVVLIRLPPPHLEGGLSIEETLKQRRSVREYGRGRLKLADVSQILWSAQGVTHPNGYRTAPSAGALYPLELYLVAGDVADLNPGVYRYRPAEHELVLIQKGDLRGRLSASALHQNCVARAPAILVIAGVYRRTAGKYGRRAQRYVHIEVGHAAQNVYLQCVSRGLATVFVGAFDDTEVQEAIGLSHEHAPLGLMPLGRER